MYPVPVFADHRLSPAILILPEKQRSEAHELQAQGCLFFT
jgi:hypothetical protein